MSEQPKEYYEKKPGFVVKSGTKQELTGKTTDYAVFTAESFRLLYSPIAQDASGWHCYSKLQSAD
jgi:hypothetical protein